MEAVIQPKKVKKKSKSETRSGSELGDILDQHQNDEKSCFPNVELSDFQLDDSDFSGLSKVHDNDVGIGLSNVLHEDFAEMAVSPICDIDLNKVDEGSVGPHLPVQDELDENDTLINTVLPVQDDDWDLSTTEQNSDIIYPSLERSTSKQSAVMKPFTHNQMGFFYQNPLLEQNEMYTDQFITESAIHHAHFKTLLQNYHQARMKLIKSRKQFEAQKDDINNLFKSVFASKQGNVSAEAYCQDQRKVKTSHNYEVCSFDKEECSKLTSALRDGRRLASDDILTCSYISTLCRLRCEQFLYDVTEKYKYHRNNLKVNSETTSSSSQLSILLQLVDECLAVLKEILNIVFNYKRQRKDPDEVEDRFWKDIDRWSSLVVLNMIQSNECENESGRHFREELFVLNHVIRCPPGINLWMNGLVQVSGPLPFTSKDKTSIDHSIYLLYLILNPSKGRQDFLSQFSSDGYGNHLPHQQQSEWTVIDEDGDEIDPGNCPTSTNIMPLENDLITLFQQVPFQSLLVHILGLTLSSEDVYEYSENDLPSEDVMATLVVSDQLCNILGESLQILGRPKYKQLVRRVAQAMRNIVLLISEHLEHYKVDLEKASHQMYSLERLQLEFDEFCKRCISKLLSVARLGIYQFIADLPFGSMSLRAIETLYLLMNVPAGARAEVEKLVRAEYSKQDWIEFVQDSDTKLAFEEQLSAMPANEIVYLLTAFANLAQMRPSEEDHLINNVIVDIYKISFIYKSTKDICCKTGRELLSSVTFHHPFTISTILHFINENISQVRSMAIYSMNDVPFHLWKPCPEDLEVLRSFLINFSPDSIESRFAQYIIKGLNFECGNDGNFFLPHQTHCHLGILLVEAHAHLMQDKQHANIMLKSLDQVSKVASVTRLAPSVEHKFTKWCWEMILQLKLHHREYIVNENTVDFIVLDLKCEVSLVPILDAIDNNCPIANFLAIMMTSIGHNMEKFLSEGIELLLVLAQLGYTRAVTKCLFCVIPIFCKAKMNLAENDRFKDVLLVLLHSADKNYFSDLASRIMPDTQLQQTPTQLVLSVISSHLSHDAGSEESSFLALYWLELVFAINDWHRNVHLQHIADFLFQHGFIIGERCNLGFKTMLYQQLVEMMLHKPITNQNIHHSSVVSSILNLMSGSNANQMPCLVNSFQHGINIYFSYAALEAETRYEDDSGLWVAVVSMLQHDAKLNIDTCFKKVAAKLKLPYIPQPANLCLYRWGELALHTPYDHPLLEVIWLNFFVRFIHLPPNGKSSVGYRFFSAVSILPTYNKLRLQLQSTSEYHVGIISGRSSKDGMKSHHERCVQLYLSFKLWLEEPKLHEVNLYLPSLPPQYNPDLLASVRTKQQDAFDSFVDLSRIEGELQKIKKDLQPSGSTKVDKKAISYKSFVTSIDVDQRMQKITQLINQFEEPKPLPYVAAYGALSSPVALGDVSQIWKYETVLQVIDLDLKIISSFAEDVLKLQNRLGKIDADYLSILPNLYHMKDVELWQKVECQSGFSVTHKCSGPAQIRLRFKEKTIHGSVSQELKANRNLYQEALNKFLNEDTSDDLCFAALHLESLIHALEGNSNNPTFKTDVTLSVQEAGTKLFYLLANMYSKERKVCHPTRHLLSSCVEILGQLFISQSSEHAENILNEVLSNPASSALLSPHFAPGATQNVSLQTQINNYIQMYQRVMKVVSTNTDEDADVLFVLLTKFEVSTWLEELQPALSERLELMQHVFVGLISCNLRIKQNDNHFQNDREDRDKDVLYKAVTHQPSHTAMQEIYLNHFTSIIKHRFPETLQQAVENLLEASCSHHVQPNVWEIVLSASFNQTLTRDTENCSSDFNKMYSTTIDWNTLLKLFENFTWYFRIPITNQEHRCSELFSKWQSYVPLLSRMFCCLGQTLLVFVEEHKISHEYFDEKLSANKHWCPLTEVIQLYHVWIDPIQYNPTAGALWPWNNNEEVLADWMYQSLSSVMVEFCKGDQTSSSLQCVFTHYAQIVLQSKHELPNYIFTKYHNMLSNLPWSKFIPSPESLDIMVQMCEINSNLIQDFLCMVVCDIPWTSFMGTYISPTNFQNIWEENSVNSRVLGQLLHAIVILGSKEIRMTKLLPVYDEVEQFPIHLIGNDQIEYVANLVSDHYNWPSIFLPQPLQSKKDVHHQVFRLLKLICRLPLVSEERVKASDGRMLVPALVANDVLKQQSYVRCVGRLLQKSKPDEFGCVSEMCQRLTRFVEITMESVEMAAAHDMDLHNLTSLVFTIFDYLNIMPPTFQEPTLRGFINVLARLPFCQNLLCSDKMGPTHISAQCQDCVYSRSRALSKKTLFACLAASCSIAIFPEFSCQIIEVCIESYVNSATIDVLGVSSSPTCFVDCWSDILKLFQVSAYQEELCIQCSKHSSLLTLHATIMDLDVMPTFYHFKQDLPDCTNLVPQALLDVTNKVLEWLPQCACLRTNEAKILLLFDQFLYACSLMWQAASSNTTKDFSDGTVAVQATKLLPILENFSLDKVRSGFLGTIGIGKQSAFSTSFRLAAKCLTMFLHQWHARVYPISTDYIEIAEKAFQSIKNLPQTNKQYADLVPFIDEICDFMENQNQGNLKDYRKLLSIFIKAHYNGVLFLHHLIEV